MRVYVPTPGEVRKLRKRWTKESACQFFWDNKDDPDIGRACRTALKLTAMGGDARTYVVYIDAAETGTPNPHARNTSHMRRKRS